MAAINLLRPEQSTNTVYLPYVSTANAAATIIQRAYTKYINHLKLHHHQHVTTNDTIENSPTLSPTISPTQPEDITQADFNYIMQMLTEINNNMFTKMNMTLDNIDRLLDDNG
jgi:hypothetical protein